MRYFNYDGQRYTDVGLARSGTRAGRTAAVSILAVVAGSVAFGVFFLRTMEGEGVDISPYILFVAFFSVVAVGAAVLITRRYLGGGRVTINPIEGQLIMREMVGPGQARTRLQISEVREVALSRSSGGSSESYKIHVLSSQGEHLLAVLVDRGDAMDFASELASLLAVPFRDGTGGFA